MRVALIVILLGSALASCPRNSRNSANRQKCFSFFDIPMSFFQADSFCENLGGRLASVVNEIEAQVIWEMTNEKTASDKFWIGASNANADLNPKGYAWLDRTSFNYTRWMKEEPNIANLCVSTLVSKSKWSTAPCSSQLPFVCIADEDVQTSCPPVPTVTCPPVTTVTCPPVPTVTCPTIPRVTCPPPPNPPTCPPVPPPRQSCPSGSTYLPETKSCYTVITGRGTQQASEAECVKLGGHLTSIHSFTENEFVNRLAHTGLRLNYNDQVWIGLQRAGYDPAVFVWTDGSPFDYEYWSPGEPNNKDGREGCVQTYADEVDDDDSHPVINHWNDQACGDAQRAAICKVPATQ